LTKSFSQSAAKSLFEESPFEEAASFGTTKSGKVFVDKTAIVVLKSKLDAEFDTTFRLQG